MAHRPRPGAPGAKRAAARDPAPVKAAATVPRSAQGRATAAAFGRRVAQYREAKGWSQGELGRQAGLSQAAVSHVEAGTRTPSIETARLLATALGVSVGVLMGEAQATAVGEEARVVELWRRVSPATRVQVGRFLRFCLAEEQRPWTDRPA